MILTAHQPSYLPWLGFFSKMVKSDIFVYLDTVSYSKWDWSSRNKIRTHEGWMWLTIPILTGGKSNQIFTEVKIDNTQQWARKHWKSISMNYSQAPFFSLYENFFRDVYSNEWKYLSELDEHITKFLMESLGIKIKFVKASTSLQLEGHKSSLVLDMCMKMKADVFIFGGEGKNYAKIENFENAGIKVIFQEYEHPVYPQIHGEFISNMSVIDLLFNCGPKSLDILLSNEKQI
jgi:hypothetical protein